MKRTRRCGAAAALQSGDGVAAAAALWFCTGAAGSGSAQDFRETTDARGDVRIIRVDPGADGPVNQTLHPLPDVLKLRVGAWEPFDEVGDVFEGLWSDGGRFLRLDAEFSGLVNPPGTLGWNQFFDPFMYGQAPLLGYIELDMDADVETGGEVAFPEVRYPGVAARWGGRTAGARFEDRLAVDGSAFDHVLATAPYVDRSGEEFHIALIGAPFETIFKKSGNGDGVFQPGETWIVTGRNFHRAHGYEPFSFACCCQGGDGHYLPDVQLQFAHNRATDVTTLSLVYPLTNAASAAMRGEGWVEGNDGDACNQNSILEALEDLTFSAGNAPGWWRSDPDFPIIADWEFKLAEECLHPRAWEATVLAASSYLAPDPDGATLVWADLLPDAVSGDVNGDGKVDAEDGAATAAYIASHDGDLSIDEDGSVNGRVDLIDFGPNFSVFDATYDGVVDSADVETCTGEESLALKCRRGKLKGKLRGGTPGHWATFELDSDAQNRVRVLLDENGRGKFRFNSLESGNHAVSYIECGLSSFVACP